MGKVDSVTMNVLADELTQEAVLHFDQEAVVFLSDGDEVVVNKKYQTLRNRMYDLIDYNLNGS